MSNILSYHDIIGLNNLVLREQFFFEKGITEDSELKDCFIHLSGLLSACLSLSLVPLFWKFNELVGMYKLIVMIWIRMTHIGSYSWMFSYQEWHYLRRIRGFDLVGVGVFLVEEVCSWWRRCVAGSELWGFKTLCQTHSLFLLCLCVRHPATSAPGGNSQLLPGYRAYNHDVGLTLWNCKQAPS